MDPINPPRLLGSPMGSAAFKSHVDDFQVEEVLGFEPSGEGEHCLVWIEKTNRNTNDVAAEMATRLGIRKRLISHCGLKDKDAITRQWFSLHLPGQNSPPIEAFEMQGVRAIRITRNTRKLHRGAHDGNRFFIRLRDYTFSNPGDSRVAMEQRWREILARGVPNYFGPQRFGFHGRNVDQALELFAGEREVRDRLVRGILISAARSYLFNACVARRVVEGTWDRPLPGDVFGFANNRSLVMPDNLHGDEADRFDTGMLELTAPLWGVGELSSQAMVQELEEETIQKYPKLVHGLQQLKLRQERRVMRLKPDSATLRWKDETTLALEFNLPKGTYATTVLRELISMQ